ncbi:MAG: formylglycine-generating enzyme family protein [Alphaproteobacteria bacterium]
MRRVFTAVPVVAVLVAGPAAAAGLDLVAVPAGTVEIGDPAGEADETPRPVAVAAFRLMRHEVTNAAFAAFVAAAGHRTDAEENSFGWVWSGRWRRVAGADWRHPSGPDSTNAGRDDHPVVQVSARDAAAFCAFHGLRLPSEAEWQRAARGPKWRRYPWGDASPEAGGARRANFGSLRCCAADAADGYLTTAPVGRFPAGASPYGLEDMAGNVWEWTASHPERAPGRVILKGGGWGNNPYCLRIGYRHANPPDIGLDMVGFRCAGDVE